MKITIVKFEKAVAVQFAGMIEELGEEYDEFECGEFSLTRGFHNLELYDNRISFANDPDSDTPTKYHPGCRSFDSNEDRDIWITKCTNCLKAWKESRQSRETSSPDVWTIDVD